MKYLPNSLIITIILITVFSCHKPPVPEKGVSHNLTKYRKDMIDSPGYKLFFCIPSEKQDLFPPEKQLRFMLPNSLINWYLISKNQTCHFSE